MRGTGVFSILLRLQERYRNRREDHQGWKMKGLPIVKQFNRGDGGEFRTTMLYHSSRLGRRRNGPYNTANSK